ncbi:Na+/H+ antiporter subunit E [Nannocystis sp. bb15-2]|uniref:Na+/H+ antiporter subunit E n=2 Tax=Nannocystis bainbridge TaxID=2995303 RepID=A0ABT5DP83_9BACT|nr:Na+/H+ antiporter subunit E [Nannocystis bainbridge]
MRALSLVILLAGYWALLSGQFHNGFLITCGVLCIAFVCWMASRMGLIDDEGAPARYYVGLLLYVPYIAWQVILANWDVLKRIWSSELAIDPRLTRIRHGTRAGFVTVTYANSITLTPGTVTMEVTETEMLVLSLTKEGEDGLIDGDMERRCKRLEGG